MTASDTQSLEAVRDHLQSQYEGILPQEQIDGYVDEYVGTRAAGELLELMRERRPDAQRVLDVGSGYGSFVLVAREAGIDASGVELAEFEVDFARRRLGSQRPDDDADDVYRVGDAHSLPFPDAAFDVVTFWNVIEHVPRAEIAIAEAARVLRPGGAVIILAPNYASVRREAHYQVPWPPLMPKTLGARYLRRLGRDPSFWTEDIHPCTVVGVRRALRDAGLVVRYPRAERLARSEDLRSEKQKRVGLALRRAGLTRLAQAAARAVESNPLAPVVFVEGWKP